MKKLNFFTIAVVSIFVFTMYSCGGNETKPADDTAKAQVKTEPTPEPIAAVKGEEIFKNTCAACHQANGEGIAKTFPPLAKSDFLANKEAVIHQVINGKSGELTVNGVVYNGVMPPQTLSDEEIASVVSYVYSSWGNSGDAITASDVKTVRDKGN